MNLASRLIGLHIVVLGFVWMLWLGSGSNLGMFIDVPSLVGILVLLLGCLLLCFTPGQAIDAIAAVISGPGGADEARRRQRVAVAAQAYQVAWGAGIVITFTTLISMLADLSDPSAIGAGMAVALLSTLYGAFLAEFVIAPCHQTLKNQLENSRNPSGEVAQTEPNPNSDRGLWRGTTVVLLMLSCFFIAIARYGEVKFDNYLSSQGVEEYRAYYAEPGNRDQQAP